MYRAWCGCGGAVWCARDVPLHEHRTAGQSMTDAVGSPVLGDEHMKWSEAGGLEWNRDKQRSVTLIVEATRSGI